MCIPVVKLRVKTTWIHWFNGIGCVVAISLEPSFLVKTYARRAPTTMELVFRGSAPFMARPSVRVGLASVDLTTSTMMLLYATFALKDCTLTYVSKLGP
jgi:hypothetical protein